MFAHSQAKVMPVGHNLVVLQGAALVAESVFYTCVVFNVLNVFNSLARSR